jgi:hypothetical protein
MGAGRAKNPHRFDARLGQGVETAEKRVRGADWGGGGVSKGLAGRGIKKANSLAKITKWEKINHAMRSSAETGTDEASGGPPRPVAETQPLVGQRRGLAREGESRANRTEATCCSGGGRFAAAGSA